MTAERNPKAAWLVVQSFGSAAARGDHALGAVPDLLKRLLAEGAWRQFVTPGGELVHHERLADFLTTPPTRGIGVSVDVVRALLRNDTEALDLLDQALERPVVTGLIQRRKKPSARDRWLVQITQDQGISDETRVLLMHLGYEYMDAGGRVAGVTQKELAKKFGWTDERAEKRVLERLAAARTRGHLTKDERSGFRGRPAIYYAVLWPGKGPAEPDPSDPGKGPVQADPLDGKRVRSKRGKSRSAEPDPFPGADGRKGPAEPDTQRARVTGRDTPTAPALLRDPRAAAGGALPPPGPPGSPVSLRSAGPDDGTDPERSYDGVGATGEPPSAAGPAPALDLVSESSPRPERSGGVGEGGSGGWRSTPRPPTDDRRRTSLGRAQGGALVGDGTDAGARERIERELAAAAEVAAADARCPHGRPRLDHCYPCLADAFGCDVATLIAAAGETDR